MEVNKCPYCGGELSEGASFCPHCEKSLMEKRTVKPPRTLSRKQIVLIAAASGIVAVMAVMLVLSLAPRTYAPEYPEVYYRVGWDKVRIALDMPSRDSTVMLEITIPSGEDFAIPSGLIIGVDDPQAFCDEYVQSIDMCCVPYDGAKSMSFIGPHTDIMSPGVYLISDVFYDADCGRNDVIWTLKMKNGDVIKLQQSVVVHKQDTVVFSYRDTPLETDDDLAALLERIVSEVPEDAAVDIYLPPVTYSRPVTMASRAANLYGTADPNTGASTTFASTVTISTETPCYPNVYDVRFVGEGGNGLVALESSVELYRCYFEGWDVGLYAMEGGGVYPIECTFRGNKVGMRFDSLHASITSGECHGNIFVENEVGMDMVNVPGDQHIALIKCVFRANENDFGARNVEMDTSQSRFE